MDRISLQVIARMRSDFPAKFGIPRQSGLVEALEAVVVFEPAFRDEQYVRGLEHASHLWLLWGFSQVSPGAASPTVRPPRLGGNRRVGVFATRSPFRPNPIGISSVRLVRMQRHDTLGTLLHVAGADLMDGSPIYDIKPYLPYTDCHPEANCGLFPAEEGGLLTVDISPELLVRVPARLRAAFLAVLAQDPRPSYHEAPLRVYGMAFAGMDVKFSVCGDTLRVVRIDLDGDEG